MKPFPFAEHIVTLVFLVSTVTAITGALIAVMTHRIIRSVCGLAISCLGLAGLYYFLHSPFLALMEILIYIGAVCITIVFAIMLSEPDEPAPEQKAARDHAWMAVALAISGGIFFGVWRLSSTYDWSAPVTRVNDGSVHSIGVALLTTFSMPFELISLALLVAILGALAIARTGREKTT
jgi:NADH-quinone oxidoreductase subunit J